MFNLNWKIAMSTVGLDGLTGYQRRGKAIKAAKLEKNPNYYDDWGKKIITILGEDGLKKRGKAIAANVDTKARGKAISIGLDRYFTAHRKKPNAARQAYRNKISNLSRKNDLSVLDNYHLWGNVGGYDLDHIYSVQDGWKNGVPPEIMSHISNLRFIPKRENARKRNKSLITLEQLLENTK